MKVPRGEESGTHTAPDPIYGVQLTCDSARDSGRYQETVAIIVAKPKWADDLFDALRSHKEHPRMPLGELLGSV